MSSSEEELSESGDSYEELEPRSNSTKSAHTVGKDVSSSEDSDEEKINAKTPAAGTSDESELSDDDSSPAIKQELRSDQVSSSASSDSESDSDSNETKRAPVARNLNLESGSHSSSIRSRQSISEHVVIKKESSSSDASSHSPVRSEKIVKKSKLFSQSVRKDSSLSNSSQSDSDEDTNNVVRSMEEDVDDPENVEMSEQGYILNFHKENLIKYSSGVMNLENLSNSNEFWLIHSPQMLSDEDLHGARLNFNTGAQFKIKKRKFLSVSYPENGTVACVLPSKTNKEYLVVGLPVKGTVVIEETVKLPKPMQQEFTSKDDVEFPTNLKVRHPLFGADYKKRLSNRLELKLRSKSSEKRKSKGKERLSIGYEKIAPVDLPQIRTDKSSKKNKNRDSINGSYSSSKERSQKEREKSVVDSNGVNGDSSSKNRKKRRRETSVDETSINEFVEPFKPKRMKFDSSTEPLTPSGRKSKTNDPVDDILSTIEDIKEEMLSSSEMTFYEEITKVKKQKKKKGEKERTRIGL